MGRVRTATINDLEDIVEIYNWAILNTVATFDTEIKTVETQKEWFSQHDSQFPIVVYEREGQIKGWASLSRWSDRCAYSKTAEISVYIEPASHREGLGSHLFEWLIDSARGNGLRSILSRIAGPSEASLKLHDKFQFELVGTMKQVGDKFGRVLDVHLLQLIL